MITQTIDVRDEATPAVLALVNRLRPHVLATRVAVAGARTWRDHLAGLPRNKHGYPSTGFWEDAARRVRGVASGDDAVISSDKIGLAQRLYGGEIPRGGKGPKMLTIPICAEAHGTTAADWGDNLVLVIIADGRKFLALWLGSEEAQGRFSHLFGRLTKRAETTANRARKFTAGSAQKKPDVIVFKSGGGAATIGRAERNMNLKFLFVLKDSVMQEGNPDVVNGEEIKQAACDEIMKAANER